MGDTDAGKSLQYRFFVDFDSYFHRFPTNPKFSTGEKVMIMKLKKITGKLQQLVKHPRQPMSGITLSQVSIKHKPQQTDGLHALRKP